MIIPFRKYHGAGNDFLMIDNRVMQWEPEATMVAFLCDRHMGIGADGMILLNSSETKDFSMRYYNSDGNESTMCGNGGRCISAFARFLGLTEDHAFFSAADGFHEAIILEEKGNISIVRLRMQDVEIPVVTQPGQIFLNTGSPHMVILVDDPDRIDLIAEARKIRFGKDFNEKGTNVNFLQMKGDQLYVRTYERGVEDETLACGTGVTASALAAALLDGKKTAYEIRTKGGMLKVTFRRTADRFTDVWLEGPAAFVFEGTIQL
ncbi:MAG: diaminopimelate epimerase [Syntrophothermus sp.]